MQVYNPTRKDISQDYNLRNYIIKAGESRYLSDDAGEHILRKRKCDGLVSLEYTEKEEQTYGSIAAFKKSKAKEGLSNLKSFLSECMRQEAYGVKESIEKNASPEIAMHFRVKEFEQMIKDVESQIQEVAGSELIVVKAESDPKMVPVKAVRRPRRTRAQMKRAETMMKKADLAITPDEVQIGA